jgi:hypothetical protein
MRKHVKQIARLQEWWLAHGAPPARRDFKPETLRALMPYTLLEEVSLDPLDLRVKICGAEVGYGCMTAKDQTLADLGLTPDGLAYLRYEIEQVVRFPAVVVSRTNTFGDHPWPVQHRTVMPLTRDGQVSHLLKIVVPPDLDLD